MTSKKILPSLAVVVLLSSPFMLAFTRAFSLSSKPSHHHHHLLLAAGRRSSPSSSLALFTRRASSRLPSSSLSNRFVRDTSHWYTHRTSSSLCMSDTMEATTAAIDDTNNNNIDSDAEDEMINGDEDDIIAQQLLEDEQGEDDDATNENNPKIEYRSEYQDLSAKFTTSATSTQRMPPGIPNGFFIIDHATIPTSGFSPELISQYFTETDIARLKLQPDNVTVPVALKLLFPEVFQSQTRARRETRRCKILLHKGPLREGVSEEERFDPARLSVGKVIARVGPGDTLAIQTRMSHNYSECKNHHDTPPFTLPVIYEDDHCAIVNKPEGVVVFSTKGSGYGRQCVKSCLPWVITPPARGVMSVLRRPNPVHRIDRGTSGLLVCAKTKPAMVEMSRLFKERKVKKTYTAVVNGNILEPKESAITSQEAINQGVCIGNSEDSTSWQVIDEELEGQSATTIWRTLKQWPLENARNDTACLVELKPKTGRYHQLRRHMAWVSNCPLLGDKNYDGGGLAKTLRDKGFYLCSNKVTLDHPFYNTPLGRIEWEANKEKLMKENKKDGGDSRVSIMEENGSVLVHCEIDLPAKFSEF